MFEGHAAPLVLARDAAPVGRGRLLETKVPFDVALRQHCLAPVEHHVVDGAGAGEVETGVPTLSVGRGLLLSRASLSHAQGAKKKAPAFSRLTPFQAGDDAADRDVEAVIGRQ